MFYAYYHQQDDKGKLCIVIPVGINYTTTNQYVLSKCLITNKYFKVAQNCFQHIPRLEFWWVIITTLYQLMLQSCYQKSARSLVNTLVLFSLHDRLRQQYWGLLKTPLISAVSAYISKMARWIFFLIIEFW